MNNDYILIGILAKKLNKDRNTILRHLRNSNFKLYKEKKGKILNVYIHKNDEEKIINFLSNSKDYRVGYTQNDLKLKNKGLLSINDICKKLNKGRCTISTVIKYLNILPFIVSNNHKFYSNNDFIKIEEFYKTHSNYEKFLAKEMRIKKYGENPYKNRNEKTIKSNIEKYGENYKEIFLQKMKQSIKEKHGDENYRNIEKTKETLHKNRLKFCKENDCSIFSEIFKTNIEHSWSTLSYCLDKLNIKPIYHKTVIYIKNSDVELLKNELKNIKYSHESIGEKQIVDRRLFNGKGYSSSGFKLLKINPPNYYYTKNLSRFYRMNFTKKNISKKFPNEYDSNLTEEENMMKLNYYRIYDCGTIKVEWNKE